MRSGELGVSILMHSGLRIGMLFPYFWLLITQTK